MFISGIGGIRLR